MYGTHDIEPKTDARPVGTVEPQVGLKDISKFLKFAWPRILIAVILTTAVAVAYLLATERTYTAGARLIFDPKSSLSFDQTTRWLESSTDMSTRIESQVEVLKSELIARKVIEKLNLVDDPEHWPSPRTIELLMPLLLPLIEPQQNELGSSVAEPIGVDAIIPGFLNNLSVRRVGLSAVIEIAYTAKTPEKAARVANALASSYIENGLDQKAEAARRGSIWLRDRLKLLRKQASDASLEAERFKSVGAGNVSDSSARLAELVSVAETYQRMRENFLLKFTETLQQISYPVSDAHLVTAASSLFVAKAPKRGAVLAFAMSVGLTIGTAFSIAQLAFDRRIRDKKMITDAGLRLLGSINSKALPVSIPAGASNRVQESRRIFRKKSAKYIVQMTALSQLRAIQVAVKSCTGGSLRTIGVVGANSGSGCTSIVTEIAHVYAASGAQTLLVDANVEDPTLSRRLAPRANSGFIDVLQGTVAPEEVITKELTTGFALMPLGNPGDTMVTPGLLLNANSQKVSLDVATNGFDVCLFDLSSPSSSSETHLIAPFLDGVVVVAEFDVTNLDDLNAAVSDLRDNNVRILGVVLNKVP